MSRTRSADFTLEAALRDPGFTPRISDVPALLEMLAGGDEDLTEQAQRALLRAGAPAARAAIERAASAPVELGRRLTAFVGRAASETPGEDLVAFLTGKLGDADAKTRQFAAMALGKIHRPEVEVALAAALEREEAALVRRSIVASLGKVGGQRALEALKALGDTEATQGDLERTRARSALMVARTLDRDAPSAFELAKAAPAPTPVTLRCRRGLEMLLRDELDADLEPLIASDAIAGARVEVMLTGAPERLLKARTMMSFGFLLDPRRVTSEADLPNALVESLVSEDARRILTWWTAGTVRYRIAWARGGKRRAAVWRTAEEVARRCPELVNDPTSSTWQAVVHEGPSAVRVELVPRFEDPRFAYRRGDVPAASHPTIAAALVRVGGIRANDVVWDPFAGSGTELCERAIAGPYRLLIGSDREESALTVARTNLDAAGIERVELHRHDALRGPPRGARPTLILTNPPMGRRVHRSADLGMLLDRFIEVAARALSPGGRLVWVSPLPHRTSLAASRAGLTLSFRQDIDMGGFEAQIQAFTRSSAGADVTPPEGEQARPGAPVEGQGRRSSAFAAACLLPLALFTGCQRTVNMASVQDPSWGTTTIPYTGVREANRQFPDYNIIDASILQTRPASRKEPSPAKRGAPR